MVTGNEILNYQGNVGLGLNSDGISSYGETDTKDLNNAVFNLAYLNLQKNKDVWQQKIKERDDAMKLIADDQLQINNVLPNHRQELENQIDEIKKIFIDNGGDIKSNKKVWVDVNDKLAKFHSANVTAKTSLDQYSKGMTEAANETDPIAKQKMLDHWKQESQKKATDIFNPYQKTLDWDPAIVIKDLPLVESTPYRSGDYDVTEKNSDVQKGWLDYATAYQYNDKGVTAPNVDAFYKSYYGLDGLKKHDDVAQSVAMQNEKLKKIAQLNGYKTDTAQDIAMLPDYLKPTKLAIDPADGMFKPTDTVPMAAYKAGLVIKYQHGRELKLNKDYSVIDKNKAEIGKLNAETEASRALALQRKSVIPLNQAKAKYWNSKGTQTDNESNLTNIFDDTMARSKVVTFYNKNAKGEVVGQNDKEVVFAGDMPQGFSQVLSGVDKKGKPIPLQPLKTKSGAEYYEVSKSPYFVSPTGVRYSQAQIQNSFKNQDKFTDLNSFMEYLEKSKDENGAGFKQEKELIGANGRGTAQATIEGLRILNNQSRGAKTDEVLSQAGDNNQEDGTGGQDNNQQQSE